MELSWCGAQVVEKMVLFFRFFYVIYSAETKEEKCRSKKLVIRIVRNEWNCKCVPSFRFSSPTTQRWSWNKKKKPKETKERIYKLLHFLFEQFLCLFFRFISLKLTSARFFLLFHHPWGINLQTLTILYKFCTF